MHHICIDVTPIFGCAGYTCSIVLTMLFWPRCIRYRFGGERIIVHHISGINTATSIVYNDLLKTSDNCLF